LAQLFSRAAQQFTARTAVSDARRGLTYAELDERTNRLAHGLIAEDAAADGRVAILMQNRVEFVEGDVACLKAGKTKVPINLRLTEHERRHILEDSGAFCLLTDADNADFAMTMLTAVPSLRTVLVADGTQDSSYERFLSHGSGATAWSAVSGGMASQLLYTSGTTGKPKGAALSFDGRLASSLTMLRDELSIGPTDVMAHVASLSHGSGSKVLPFLLRGGENRLFESFDPEQLLGSVAAGVTASFMVPTMIQRLVDAYSGQDLSGLNQITYGGAPISVSRLREAMDTLGPVFGQVYGSCEAPHPLTVLSKQSHVTHYADDSVLRSAGIPTLSTIVTVTDSDGHEVANGEIGEIRVRTPSLMTGYWGNPAATGEVMVEGFYRTGDVGFRDPRGFITLVDRDRDVIISGGLNIYPAEVEGVLLQHPEVAEVAVVGGPDEEWGEAVRAFVVRAAGSTVDPASLLTLCQERLAGYKKPRSFEFVDSLPKGATGKILKRQLRDGLWAGRARGIN
jgi:acyl-CoA synthetase (AMP-forming)/AMP-acid ligase II